MADITMTGTMSPKLLKVMERAKRDPQAGLRGLARFIDEAALTCAFHALRKDAAVGVDGITKGEYGQALENNIRDLHERLKAGRYRHQAIRRVHIPKEKGKTRPLGISSTEDKIVQQALREVLEPIYEWDFIDCSYGYRPGRSAHGALGALDRAAMRGEVNWVLEADVKSFFDSLDRTKLKEMLRQRVADESLMRLVGKCLQAGILDGEDYSEPESGVAQGSVLSPLLGNVYLHYVLDLWFEREVLPRLRGKAHLIRYCDDFVIGFEWEDDAKRVMDVLGRRLGRFGLMLHPDKTRLLPFRRPAKWVRKSKGLATFDFLGFALHWRRNRKGGWVLGFKTRKARLRRAIVGIAEWCRRHRHWPVKEQHAALTRRIQGHFNYFGVNGNLQSLRKVRLAVTRAWYKWLRRRSQRTRLNWRRFKDLLRSFPLPAPRICVRIWAPSP
jgi:group II intron reverse transcriptase/maturase